MSTCASRRLRSDVLHRSAARRSSSALKVPRGRVALKRRVLRSSLLAPHRFLGCRVRRLVSSDVAVPGHPSQRELEAAALHFEGAKLCAEDVNEVAPRPRGARGGCLNRRHIVLQGDRGDSPELLYVDICFWLSEHRLMFGNTCERKETQRHLFL